MSAITTLEKIVKALLKTHPNPTSPIQDLYNSSIDKREKEEIKAITLCWGIKLDEE